MKEKKNNLQKEQGSVQRQVQRNEDYRSTDNRGNGGQFGIVPFTQAKKNKPNTAKPKPELKEVDDEKIIPGMRTKRSPWNSVDFEADDFFGSWVPA